MTGGRRRRRSTTIGGRRRGTAAVAGTYLSPGYGFGLGCGGRGRGIYAPDNDGVFRWAGAANTYFRIDPAAELIGMVWTQFNPFAAYDLEREFQTLVYEALQ